MRADPVWQLLGPREFREGEAGHAERSDEQLGLADFTGVRVDDAELLARVVDEQLLARHVRLPHRDRKPLCPFLVSLAKPTVAAAVWMLRLVFLPQQIERDVLAAKFAVDLLPVR